MAALVAAVGSGTAITINYATGPGGTVWWVLVCLLTVVSAVLSRFSHGSLRGRRGWSLVSIVLIILIVPIAVASDRAHEPPPREPVTAAPPTTSRVPQPLPGAATATVFDPQALTLAKRLTEAVRQSGAIPQDVRVEPVTDDGGIDDVPLKFEIRQGEFRATADLRKNQVVATLTITVYWGDGQAPSTLSCPDQQVPTDYCGVKALADGSAIQNQTTMNENGAVEGESITSARTDGTWVLVDLTSVMTKPLSSRQSLPLDTENLVTLASLDGLSIAQR